MPEENQKKDIIISISKYVRFAYPLRDIQQQFKSIIQNVTETNVSDNEEKTAYLITGTQSELIRINIKKLRYLMHCIKRDCDLRTINLPDINTSSILNSMRSAQHNQKLSDWIVVDEYVVNHLYDLNRKVNNLLDEMYCAFAGIPCIQEVDIELINKNKNSNKPKLCLAISAPKYKTIYREKVCRSNHVIKTMKPKNMINVNLEYFDDSKSKPTVSYNNAGELTFLIDKPKNEADKEKVEPQTDENNKINVTLDMENVKKSLIQYGDQKMNEIKDGNETTEHKPQKPNKCIDRFLKKYADIKNNTYNKVHINMVTKLRETVEKQKQKTQDSPPFYILPLPQSKIKKQSPQIRNLKKTEAGVQVPIHEIGNKVPSDYCLTETNAKTPYIEEVNADINRIIDKNSEGKRAKDDYLMEKKCSMQKKVGCRNSRISRNSKYSSNNTILKKQVSKTSAKYKTFKVHPRVCGKTRSAPNFIRVIPQPLFFSSEDTISTIYTSISNSKIDKQLGSDSESCGTVSDQCGRGKTLRIFFNTKGAAKITDIVPVTRSRCSRSVGNIPSVDGDGDVNKLSKILRIYVNVTHQSSTDVEVSPCSTIRSICLGTSRLLKSISQCVSSIVRMQTKAISALPLITNKVDEIVQVEQQIFQCDVPNLHLNLTENKLIDVGGSRSDSALGIVETLHKSLETQTKSIYNSTNEETLQTVDIILKDSLEDCASIESQILLDQKPEMESTAETYKAQESCKRIDSIFENTRTKSQIQLSVSDDINKQTINSNLRKGVRHSEITQGFDQLREANTLRDSQSAKRIHVAMFGEEHGRNDPDTTSLKSLPLNLDGIKEIEPINFETISNIDTQREQTKHNTIFPLATREYEVHYVHRIEPFNAQHLFSSIFNQKYNHPNKLLNSDRKSKQRSRFTCQYANKKRRETLTEFAFGDTMVSFKKTSNENSTKPLLYSEKIFENIFHYYISLGTEVIMSQSKNNSISNCISEASLINVNLGTEVIMPVKEEFSNIDNQIIKDNYRSKRIWITMPIFQITAQFFQDSSLTMKAQNVSKLKKLKKYIEIEEKDLKYMDVDNNYSYSDTSRNIEILNTYPKCHINNSDIFNIEVNPNELNTNSSNFTSNESCSSTIFPTNSTNNLNLIATKSSKISDKLKKIHYVDSISFSDIFQLVESDCQELNNKIDSKDSIELLIEQKFQEARGRNRNL